MNSEHGQPHVSYNDALENAQKLKDVISCFLKLISADDLQTYFDGLALSLAIKELETFVDVIILVERNRYEGAKARLRSIWESLLILKYNIYCVKDKELSAEALFLYEEDTRFNTIKENKFFSTLTQEAQDEYQEYADRFQGLYPDLKKFCKTRIIDKYKKLTEIAPSAMPFFEVNSIKVSQYDVIFRTFSRPAHGGLPGSQNQVQQWLDNKTIDQALDENEASGILCAGYSWLKDIVESWVNISSVSSYQMLWNDSTINSD